MKKKKNTESKPDDAIETNKNWQGVDMDPEEEKGKGEKVTNTDLKGKIVDGDPSKKSDQPVKQF